MVPPRLLTRDLFRQLTLTRHDGLCCVPDCGQPATDAHHILNRNLFTAAHQLGGYYLENSANLCPAHHLAAEQTTISTTDLYHWCQITGPARPEHLATDTEHDTWGNPVLPDETRLPGELFYTDGCQKALTAGGHLWRFSTRFKYPRTLHAPWSPGLTGDDKTQHDLSAFTGHDVVITLKMDGEATTIYPDGHTHARSVDTKPHPSRDIIRALAGRIAHDIPDGWRVCGEALYARHSIAYENLPDYFLVYNIWDRDRCLSWADTLTWVQLLNLTAVPTIYEGPMPTPAECQRLFAPHADQHEGYVIRLADGFTLAEFTRSVIKVVRAGHVQTGTHWLHETMHVNSLEQP
ncbi:MAG: RNA ligase family protein [Propionicimonas sp.]